MTETPQPTKTLYLYGISRKDLPVHQQAIQAAHAQLEYFRTCGNSNMEHPTFVWLTVENRRELLTLHSVLKSFSVVVVPWSDPDYEGYEMSAISCLLTEEQRFLLSDLPLWTPYLEPSSSGRWLWP